MLRTFEKSDAKSAGREAAGKFAVERMWGVGLSRDEQVRLAEAMGSGFVLKNLSPTEPPVGMDPDSGSGPGKTPETAWIPWRAWRAMPEETREAFLSLETTQRILIQDEHDEDVEIEDVLAQGFLTVIRQPLTRSKVRDAMFRAKEVSTLYADIYRMTREIFLERELLSRKTDQLSFLNTLLSTASSSLDPAEILAGARRDLCLLLPVHLITAVFFSDARDAENHARFFLPLMTPEAEEAWTEFLLGQIVSQGFGPVDGFQVESIPMGNTPLERTPSHGRAVVLPLKSGTQTFGLLALLCDTSARLAKDQLQTLKAAVNHLALSLHNAMIHSAVKVQADHDGLTRLYNRRSFDERLRQELVRSRRYGNELSLMMIDLDHFKEVNDRHGHAAGDAVLTQVALLLADSMRASDFAARYGGEEFAVLLPHTGKADALHLAERLRQSIEGKRFASCEQHFSITASIGVSSLDGRALSPNDDLLLRADQALYAAKGNGRNAVRADNAQAADSVAQ